MASTSTEYKLAIKIAGKVSSSFTSAMGSASSTLAGLGHVAGTAAKVAGVAIGAAAAAMAGFTKSAVEAGMEFDKSMSQVAATMGTSAEEITDLRNLAIEMGSKTAFSATEAAEALNYMALAGYDAATQTAMLPTVLNLAAAGGMELARASDMITDSQSALGLTLEQTAAMVDQMAQAASKSNTSVEQLGDAILTVGGTAQYMAGGTEEINTVLGILADNGIKGSEAGTHLRNMLLKLSDPSKDATKLLNQMGVQVFDTEGKMRSFSDIFPELNAAMDSMTDQQKLDAMSTLFNSRDIASATALLGTSVERWDELGDAILNSAGAAEQMANTQLDNLSGDITLWKSALEGAQITLSDQLTPTLREFVQFGTDGLTQITEAFSSGGLAGAMEALGGVLSDALDSIVSALPMAIDAGMQLLGALGKGILDNLPTIISAALQVVAMFIEGIAKALPSIITGGIQAITALMTGMIEALPTLIPLVADAVVQSIDTIIPALTEAGVQLFLSLIQNLPAILAGIGAAVLKIIQAILSALAILPGAMSEIFSAAWEGIKAVFAPVGAFFQGIWNTIVSLFTSIGTAVADAISGAVRGAINAVVGGAVRIINKFIDSINLCIGVINALPGVSISSLSRIQVPQFAEGGVVTGPTFLEAGEAGSEAIIPLSELWKQMQSFVADAITAPADWITEAIDAMTRGKGEGDQDDDDPPPQVYITYSPQYSFSGEAPKREDLVEAEIISQDEFNRMAQKWLKGIRRSAFA